MSNEPRLNILSEEVLYQSGSFRRVRRYVEGRHPHLGPLSFGWSGRETVWETDAIRPVFIVNINQPGE